MVYSAPAAAERWVGQAQIIGELAQGQDGVIEGWCQVVAEPARRPEVELWLDDMLVGVLAASAARAELRAAGIGDGAYGFSLRLPQAIGGAAGGSVLLARECASGQVFARLLLGSVVLPDPAVLDGLAGQVGQLWARLDRAPPAGEDARALAAAFGGLGGRLRAAAHGRPTPLAVELAVLGEDVARRLGGLALPRLAAPEYGLLLPAQPDALASLALLRPCIGLAAALPAALVLLDAGDDPRHALLPALIPGLVRLPAGQRDRATALNWAMAELPGRVLVLLAGAAADAGALELLAGPLRAAPEILLGPAPSALLRARAPEALGDAASIDLARALPFHLAVQRGSFEAIGGFESQFGPQAATGDAAHAAEFALRACRLGRRVTLTAP